MKITGVNHNEKTERNFGLLFCLYAFEVHLFCWLVVLNGERWNVELGVALRFLQPGLSLAFSLEEGITK